MLQPYFAGRDAKARLTFLNYLQSSCTFTDSLKIFQKFHCYKNFGARDILVSNFKYRKNEISNCYNGKGTSPVIIFWAKIRNFLVVNRGSLRLKNKIALIQAKIGKLIVFDTLNLFLL